MDCDQLADLIDAYVDGELTAPQAAAVARHLAGCLGCTSLLASREALRTRLRAVGGHRTPVGFAGRVSRTLDEADLRRGAAPALAQSGRRRPWWLLASHSAAAAAGALALFLVWSGGNDRNSSNSTGEILSAHLRGLATAEVGPVTSGETHVVRPWFAGKVDFAPPVADLSDAGFPLLGGHVDFLGARPAAALAYGRRLHRISLFVAPVAAAGLAGPAASSARGYNLLHWRDDSFAYWAISDLNRGELTEFQRSFQAAVGKPPMP